MRYVLSPKIRCDLEEIADWVARDSSARALAVVRELRGEFKRVAANPWLYQVRSEIGADARLAVLGRHVILFRIDGEVGRFERVAHGGRDLPGLYR